MPYKNSEKRKEKSRDAARNRRGKEMKVFAELGNYLPVSDETLSQLDKATVMRVAISHLKLRKLCIGEEINSNPKNEESLLMDPLYLKAMEGFLMILGDEGDLTYVSENVSKFLGLQQLDLIGQNIYEFSHPCDHDEMKEVISEHVVKKEGDNSPIKHFFMRLKCTLTSKGRNVNLKSATYKVIKCTGKSVTIPADALSHMGDNNPMRVMLIIGEPIPHPSNIETPLDGQTFVSRHSMDMSFTCCDDRVYDLIGYRPSNLIGMSLYDFHHALDSEEVDRAYKTLFAKGQTMTEPYRFLACGGGYAWMQTQATVIYNTRTEKPQCVVCVHFVVSGVEQEDMILSGVQEPQDNESMETDTVPESPDELTFNTESIFAPLTKEKEQDFFRQTELQSLLNVILCDNVNFEDDGDLLGVLEGQGLEDIAGDLEEKKGVKIRKLSKEKGLISTEELFQDITKALNNGATNNSSTATFNNSATNEVDCVKSELPALLSIGGATTEVIQSIPTQSVPQSPTSPYSNGLPQPQSPTITYSNGLPQPQSPTILYSNGLPQPQSPTITYSNGLSQPQSPTVTYSSGLPQPQSPTITYSNGFPQPQSPTSSFSSIQSPGILPQSPNQTSIGNGFATEIRGALNIAFGGKSPSQMGGNSPSSISGTYRSKPPSPISSPEMSPTFKTPTISTLINSAKHKPMPRVKRAKSELERLLLGEDVPQVLDTAINVFDYGNGVCETLAAQSQGGAEGGQSVYNEGDIPLACDVSLSPDGAITCQSNVVVTCQSEFAPPINANCEKISASINQPENVSTIQSPSIFSQSHMLLESLSIQPESTELKQEDNKIADCQIQDGLEYNGSIMLTDKMLESVNFEAARFIKSELTEEINLNNNSNQIYDTHDMSDFNNESTLIVDPGGAHYANDIIGGTNYANEDIDCAEALNFNMDDPIESSLCNLLFNGEAVPVAVPVIALDVKTEPPKNGDSDNNNTKVCINQEEGYHESLADLLRGECAGINNCIRDVESRALQSMEV